MQAALKYADAIVKGEEKIPIDVEEFIKSKDLPLLDFQAGELAKEVYKNFYIEEVINAN